LEALYPKSFVNPKLFYDFDLADNMPLLAISKILLSS